MIFDPDRLLGSELLRGYHLDAARFHRIEGPIVFPHIGLGMRLWQGRYEDLDGTWLRWADAEGVLIPTGHEQRERADAERERADRLAEQLRRLGVEPPRP